MESARAGGVRAEPDDQVSAMTIFRLRRRAARVPSPSEVDRQRDAARELPPPVPATGEDEQAKTDPGDIEARAPQRDAFEAGGDAREGPCVTIGDVPIVATKGRWLGPRSLVVEVELTLPANLTLAQSAVLTESVEAAVVSVIPEARGTSYR
jgi:hypothetical protein